ncbi:hypothetical protein [Rhizobium laguerreae]|uniref:hypothetical protein n=1 Tax=Rhizobium laguerreae TaxID=1076926 RepID=UPI001FEC7E62|nr:hypothetical protein [Rhizobium laguerreae]
MKRYSIRLTDEAELDLASIYSFVRKTSASSTVARDYVARIKTFVSGFETYPSAAASAIMSDPDYALSVSSAE